MRLVLQRVRGAQVTVVATGEQVANIGKGLAVLVGVSTHDTWADAEYCIRKILRTRVWENAETGAMWEKGAVDNRLEILLVSQFTLFGNLKKGYKPDFHGAMKADDAVKFFDRFVTAVRKAYAEESGVPSDAVDKIQVGSFGNEMYFDVQGHGPVTLTVDTFQMQLKRPKDWKGGLPSAGASEPALLDQQSEQSESPA